MRKPMFCICKNIGAYQLHGNREADEHLCFCYLDSTIPLLTEAEMQPLTIVCSCTAWFVSDLVVTQNDGFLMTLLKCADEHYIEQIVQSLIFLNLKFPASSHLLWMHPLVCPRARRPEDHWSCKRSPVFGPKRLQRCLKQYLRK